MTNRLREIQALGQSVWIDNLNRQLLDEGTLRRLIDEDGISGVTSNPTIFEKGMAQSDRYDDAFREVAADTDDPHVIFERLAYRDVRDAADLLRPTFEETEGLDGYVSFELPASLAFDAETLVRAAAETGALVTAEDHWPEGGLGEAVLSALADSGESFRVRKLGVEIMPGSGTPEELLREAGIDADAIAAAARELVGARATA